MTVVDDYGRYDGRSAIVRGSCFALRHDIKDGDTSALLDELDKAGLIEVYHVADKKYLQITKWRERLRSKSKWPGKDDLPQTAADCSNPLLPTPYALRPTPAPTPSVAGVDLPELPVELPAGFPLTVDDAIRHAAMMGCPVDFVTKAYNKATGRGGRDHRDVPIRRFTAWLAGEWAYERERIAKEASKKKRNVPNL